MSEKNNQEYWKNQISEFGYIKGPVACSSNPYLAENDVVGFCHSIIHPGLIKRSVFKGHKCCDGDTVCVNFEKFDAFPYWQEQEVKAIRKQYRKDLAREKKERKEKLQIEREKAFQLEDVKEKAQGFADKLGYNIHIVSVTHSNRKSKKKYYKIVYTSENDYDDCRQYTELLYELQKYYWATFILVHQKDINGVYQVKK